MGFQYLGFQYWCPVWRGICTKQYAKHDIPHCTLFWQLMDKLAEKHKLALDLNSSKHRTLAGSAAEKQTTEQTNNGTNKQRNKQTTEQTNNGTNKQRNKQTSSKCRRLLPGEVRADAGREQGTPTSTGAAEKEEYVRTIKATLQQPYAMAKPSGPVPVGCVTVAQREYDSSTFQYALIALSSAVIRVRRLQVLAVDAALVGGVPRALAPREEPAPGR
jgi:hypothetical protein